MKELIERLRKSRTPGFPGVFDEAADALEQQEKRIAELERATDHAIEINNALQSELEHQAKQIEELAAALAVKDEALRYGEIYAPSGSKAADVIADSIALQPHASLVAKIKANVVRDAAEWCARFDKYPYGELLDYAARIERGEVK